MFRYFPTAKFLQKDPLDSLTFLNLTSAASLILEKDSLDTLEKEVEARLKKKDDLQKYKDHLLKIVKNLHEVSIYFFCHTQSADAKIYKPDEVVPESYQRYLNASHNMADMILLDIMSYITPTQQLLALTRWLVIGKICLIQKDFFSAVEIATSFSYLPDILLSHLPGILVTIQKELQELATSPRRLGGEQRRAIDLNITTVIPMLAAQGSISSNSKEFISDQQEREGLIKSSSDHLDSPKSRYKDKNFNISIFPTINYLIFTPNKNISIKARENGTLKDYDSIKDKYFVELAKQLMSLVIYEEEKQNELLQQIIADKEIPKVVRHRKLERKNAIYFSGHVKFSSAPLDKSKMPDLSKDDEDKVTYHKKFGSF